MGGLAKGAVSSGTRQMAQATQYDETQGPAYTSPPCGPREAHTGTFPSSSTLATRPWASRESRNIMMAL